MEWKRPVMQNKFRTAFSWPFVTCESGRTLALKRVEQVDTRSAIEAGVNLANVCVYVTIETAPSWFATAQVATALKIKYSYISTLMSSGGQVCQKSYG